MIVQGYIEELDNIKKEIIRNNMVNRGLRVRVKELENSIGEYLHEQDQVGITYKNHTVVLEKRTSRIAKKKCDKELDVVNFLKGLGIPDPDNVYNHITTLTKGELVDKQKLKLSST